jgi:hypothetical protein
MTGLHSAIGGGKWGYGKSNNANGGLDLSMSYIRCIHDAASRGSRAFTRGFHFVVGRSVADGRHFGAGGEHNHTRLKLRQANFRRGLQGRERRLLGSTTGENQEQPEAGEQAARRKKAPSSALPLEAG